MNKIELAAKSDITFKILVEVCEVVCQHGHAMDDSEEFHDRYCAECRVWNAVTGVLYKAEHPGESQDAGLCDNPEARDGSDPSCFDCERYDDCFGEEEEIVICADCAAKIRAGEDAAAKMRMMNDE